MTWFRYECGFASHPAGRAAGLKGRALWTEGLDHSTVHLTDGRIEFPDTGTAILPTSCR